MVVSITEIQFLMLTMYHTPTTWAVWNIIIHSALISNMYRGGQKELVHDVVHRSAFSQVVGEGLG